MGKEILDFFGTTELPFVILHHSGTQFGNRRDHWDWLLDWPRTDWKQANASIAETPDARWAIDEERLITFCSVAPPALWISQMSFFRLAPHRRAYLDYQGEVAGGRGWVQRVACGRIRWHELSATRLAFRIVDSDFFGAPFPDWQGASYCLQHDSIACSSPVGSNLPNTLGLPSTHQPRAWFCRDSDSVAEWTLQAALLEVHAPPPDPLVTRMDGSTE